MYREKQEKKLVVDMSGIDKNIPLPNGEYAAFSIAYSNSIRNAHFNGDKIGRAHWRGEEGFTK